jgi:2-succinyl-5-enolpyruvyl-6-hydroxy-3-cyclohexene-1-carboxylate synthase
VTDVTYLSIRSFFAELAAQGVTDVLVSPGSRSTPLAISAHREPGLNVSIHLDERSAGFWALGMAKATQRPVALVCTSGTAAANYLPAVIEAHYSEVPLLVLTADRPPELRDRGAGQTIDQLDIYGRYARWWIDLPIPGDASPNFFKSTAARAVRTALGTRPGPVHLNWPLREPLEPAGESTPDHSPPIRTDADTRSASSSDIAWLTEVAGAHERGLVLAGPMHSDHFSDVTQFCRRTGWPLLAEPLSQLRRMADGVVTVAHHDHLLRTRWADEMVPDVVIRVGQPMTCKPLRLWLEHHRPDHIVIDPSGTWTDASETATALINAAPSVLGDIVVDRGLTPWSGKWSAADRGADEAINHILDSETLLEAAVARELGRRLPAGSTLYVSNSMPVRDIDTFQGPRHEPLTMFGNRGSSGIDGVVSSAAGAATTGRTTTLLIGDLALMHDMGGLLAAVEHEVDLTIVVPNNNGGGIFSFLPLASSDNVDLSGAGSTTEFGQADFETLFRTPQRHSIQGLVEGLAVNGTATHRLIDRLDDLGSALSEPSSGLRVLEIPVDRDANIEQHRRIAAAVATAVAPS